MATTVPHTLPVDPARSQCKRTQEPNDQVLFTETFFTLGRYLCPSPSLPDVFLATPSPQHCPSCTPESSAMSQRFSLSPLQYRILTYETDSSHLCTQDSRNRRESKGAGLPFIEAAKLEIPCLPAVCVRLSWTLCSCKCFHFLYRGFCKQKCHLIKRVSSQPILCPSCS